MAHPKRKEWAEELSEKLGGVPIGWDDKNQVWDTRKKALELIDKDSKYALVLQDDAIICDDFLKKVEEFILNIEGIYPDEDLAFQLFYGNRVQNRKEIDRGMAIGHIRKKFLSWGVAIITPTRLIRDMIRFGNGYYSWQDDTKIKHFLLSRGIPMIYPMPCLVDHRRMKENPTLVPSKDSDRYSNVFIDGQQKPTDPMIPKIIHQIWIGDKSLIPERIMNTWKINDWQYALWTEKEIDAFGLENRKLYDFFYKKKNWHGCSDVVRIEVLKRYGGIYIDADSERLADITELLNHEFFSVFANKQDRVANGTIGCIPNHPIIEAYIHEMGKAKTVEPVWNTIGGTMFTQCIADYFEKVPSHERPRVQILKPQTFYPFDSKGKSSLSRGKTYSRHYWGSTHKSYGNDPNLK